MSADPAYQAIVLYFRRGRQFKLTLRALLRQDAAARRVVVVDNGSGDGVCDALKTDPEFAGVEFLVLSENRGYSGGMNAGLEHLGSDGIEWTLLLTHEVGMPPYLASTMIAAAPADAAVVGPLVRDGRSGDVWSAGGRMRWTGLPRHRHVAPQPDPYPVTWIDGCCVLVRNEALRARGGRLDTRYFLYWEDMDLSRELSQAGRVMLVPTVSVTQTTGGMPPYFSVRGRLIYWRKWGSPAHVLMAVLAAYAAMFRAYATGRSIEPFRQGLRDGLGGRLSTPGDEGDGRTDAT